MKSEEVDNLISYIIIHWYNTESSIQPVQGPQYVISVLSRNEYM